MAASTQKVHIERGRPQAPRRRGTLDYTSLRLPSKDRSAFISPDRITRHASPSRWTQQQNNQQVVSRVPQPYRTSFSAVTSPVRIQHRPSSGSSGSLPSSPLHKGPLRATTVISSPDRYKKVPSPDRYGARWNSVSSHGSAASRSPSRSPVRSNSRSKDQLSDDGIMINGKHDITCSTVDSIFDGRSTGEKSTEHVHMSLTNGDESVREFMSSPDRLNSTNDTSMNTPTLSFTVQGQVEVKTFIQKEYVHIADISYFKTAEKTLTKGDDSIAQDHTQGKSEPTSPAQGSPRSRSSTLPSQSLARRHMTSTPVKKSLSTSITNFFKKMSPKVIRKSSKAFVKGKYVESPNSSSTSLIENDSGSVGSDAHSTPPHKQKSGKFSKFVTGGKKSKKSNGNSKQSVISKNDSATNDIGNSIHVAVPPGGMNSDSALHSPGGQPMSSDSKRILRSIEDNTQAANDKSVYHAFKEKQSPKRVTEAVGLKAQALKAVEFPDHLLQMEEADHKHAKLQSSPKGNSLPGTLDRTLRYNVRLDDSVVTLPDTLDCTPRQNITLDDSVVTLPDTLGRTPRQNIKLDDSVVTLSKLEDSVDGFHKLGDTATAYHKQRLDPHSSDQMMHPPKTLNVREVAELSKGTWQWPGMSSESLGQCSLDIYSTTGKSQTLITHRNTNLYLYRPKKNKTIF